MKKFVSLILGLLAVSMISCDDDEKEKKFEGLEVKTVQAVSCIDISNRKDWNFRFGYAYSEGIFYNYTANGKNINATSPKDQPCHYYERTKEGDKLSPANAEIYIRFVPSGYFYKDNEPDTRSTPPIPPAIQDQSTPEKLLKADALYCNYTGTATNNITAVKLVHENAFLDFYTINIPENAEITIINNSGIDEITPYKKGESHYNAIILAESKTTKIAAQINNKPYTVELSFNEASDLYHGFQLRLDEIKNELVIEKLKTIVWSESLSFQKKEIVEFKLFIGSPDGAKEASTASLTPEKFWRGSLIYYPDMVYFENDETVSLIPHDTDSDTFKYKFDKGAFYRYNPYGELWFEAGAGDKQTLKYNRGYCYVNYFDTSFPGGRSVKGTRHGNGIASATGLHGEKVHSLESLKQETDSIMWCNIHYEYQ